MEKDKQEGKKSGVAPVAEGKKKNVTSYVVLFLVGTIFGILIAPIFWGNTSDENVATGTENTNTETEHAMSTSTISMTEGSAGYSVTVPDQLAGDRVLLQTVTFAKTGWAVVHEDLDGALGNALGAQRLEPGTHDNVHVELLRNTETGNRYHVVLYADDGDGEFNLKSDMPLHDENGALIEGSFEAIYVDRKN